MNSKNITEGYIINDYKIIQFLKDNRIICQCNQCGHLKNISKYDFLRQENKHSRSNCKEDFFNCNNDNLFSYKIGECIKTQGVDIEIIDRKIIKVENKLFKKYKYVCKKCGYHSNWVIKNNLKRKCPCCINQIVVNGINDIPTIAPWMIKYFPKGVDEAKLYTPGSGKKVNFKCPFCNRIKSNKITICSLYNKKTISCVCSDGISYPEKFVYNFLEQLNLEFTFQYTPYWSNHKRYDFYFIYNNQEYIIETDGEQHFKDSMFSSYENIHKNDTTKDEMAILNKVNLIRIDCRVSNVEYIKNNIMHTELNNLFDLKNINWEQCELFATNNFIKNVCDFTSQNMNLSFNKIANHFKIAPSTVRKYIKYGDRLGWINYEEKLNNTEIDNSNQIKTLDVKKQYVENSKGLYSMKQSLKEIIEDDNKKRSEEIFYKFLY